MMWRKKKKKKKKKEFVIYIGKGTLLNTLGPVLGSLKGYILRAGQTRNQLKTYKNDNLIWDILDLFNSRKLSRVIYHINLLK